MLDYGDMEDLKDILVVFFQGHDVGQLDELVKRVKIQLALEAGKQGYVPQDERSPVCA